MKFLCLPGGYNNAKVFSAQLNPLCEELEADGSASFVFTEGVHSATPPAEFADFFGPPPHYSFLNSGSEGSMFHFLRDLLRGDSAEETIRHLLDTSRQKGAAIPDVRPAMDHLNRLLDEDDEIQGVIGYSEGSLTAATLLLEEQRRDRELGIVPKIKLAIFFSGWPPLDPKTSALVMQEGIEALIKIPTCHIIGTSDPYIDGCVALYNLCDPDEADIFDHGGGHIIPRDKPTLKELAEVLRDMIRGVKEANEYESRQKR